MLTEEYGIPIMEDLFKNQFILLENFWYFTNTKQRYANKPSKSFYLNVLGGFYLIKEIEQLKAKKVQIMM